MHQQTISELNETFIRTICKQLGIQTRITHSWDYDLVDGKTERLVGLSQQAGAGVYVSGPAAKDYVDESLFQQAGIALEWFEYGGYPEYPQMWGDFTHGVTILDVMFNCGPKAAQAMKFVCP